MNYKSYSSFLVSHHILSNMKDDSPVVTPLKLIKMVYIAHGYHLAITNSPLIDSEVEAWKYGPVVREIYHAVKAFGKNKIPTNLFHVFSENEEIEQESKKIIHDVVASYEPYTGIELSTATHKEKTPWSKVYKKEGAGAIIDNDIIRSYYKTLL